MTQGLHDEEVLGKVYDTTLVRRLWPFLRPHSGLLVLGLVLFPPLILFELLPARLFALGLDHLVGTAERSEWAWLAWLAQPPEGLPLLVWLAVLMLGVTVLGGALNLARMVAMAVMGQRAMRDLRRVLFDHVQRLPLRFFDRYPVGRLVTRLTNDIETLSEMFTSGVVQVITDLLKLAVIALVLFQLDTWLALAAMALVPLLTVAALIFRWKVRAAFRIVRVKIARINAHIQ
ncbi:MAG: ABC transporter transmembrane domain-containing protein, partial [Myxococcota bacterium]